MIRATISTPPRREVHDEAKGMRRLIGHERGAGKAAASIAVIHAWARILMLAIVRTSSVRSFGARFRKSLGQVIDHRANASGHEAPTWHYGADRYGFAFILRKQSNQPAGAKVCRDVHAGFVGDAFSAHSPLANDERVSAQDRRHDDGLHRAGGRNEAPLDLGLIT